MSRDVQLREAFQPPQGDLDPADLEPKFIVLCQVWSEDEARRVKEILDNQFIPSYFGPDNIELLELTACYDDGIEVKVREVDRERGLHTLRWYPPNEAPAEPVAEYSAACPRCQSPDIVFCGLDDDSQIDGSVARSPFNWRCDACGNQWKDDGIEEGRSSASGS